MRLHRRGLKTVYVFKRVETESDYVGTENKYVPCRPIKCNVQPAENKITVEMYGEKVYCMCTLICDIDCDVGDAVSFERGGAPTHKIISLSTYSTHKKAIAEIMQ